MQTVKIFALEPYSKLCSFHHLFVNRNVSVCQISMRFEKANCAWNTWFTEFNYEDLEEIVHLEFIGNASRYIHTHYAYAITFIVYSIQVFSSYDDKV